MSVLGQRLGEDTRRQHLALLSPTSGVSGHLEIPLLIIVGLSGCSSGRLVRRCYYCALQKLLYFCRQDYHARRISVLKMEDTKDTKISFTSKWSEVLSNIDIKFSIHQSLRYLWLYWTGATTTSHF